MNVNFVKIFLIISIVTQNTFQVSKCNRRVQSSFLLGGAKYSQYAPMKICPQIHDKCCTLADEIKIQKLWHGRLLPILDAHNDEYMFYMKKTIEQYWELMTLDPRLTVLKYYDYIETPFNHLVCNAQVFEETKEEKRKFLQYNDKKIFMTLTKNKPFDQNTVNRQVLNGEGDRDWGIKGNLESFSQFKSYAQQIEYNQISCTNQSPHFYKEQLALNEQKSEYCLDLYQRFLKFDPNHLVEFLPVIKNSLSHIHSYKAAVYCSICDAHQQKFFNIAKSQFIVKNSFCQSLLMKKKEFFEFIHILLIQYFDKILQYISCFETGGGSRQFPYQTFLKKYIRRIPFIQKCFQNLNQDDFMEHCWFICHKYNLLKLNAFYDGDLVLVKRIYMTIYSFIRKFKMHQEGYPQHNVPMEEDDEVDGLVVEPINPSIFRTDKYYVAGGSQEKLKDPIKQDKKEKTVNEILKEMGMKGLDNITSIVAKANEPPQDPAQSGFATKKLPIVKSNGKFDIVDYLASTNTYESLAEKGYFQGRSLHLKDEHIKEIADKLYKLGVPKKMLKRNLKQKIKIERMLKNKKKKKKKSKKEDPERLLSFIEPSFEMFESLKPPVFVDNFSEQWSAEGIDPLNHFNLINFNYNITEIIQEAFVQGEKLDQSTTILYFKATPQKINNFNHKIDKIISPINDLPYAEETLKIKEEIAYAKKTGNKELLYTSKKKLKKLNAMIIEKQKRLEAEKLNKEVKEKFKKMKIEKKQKEKIIQNHHIDQPNFKRNFEGIEELFIKIFGA